VVGGDELKELRGAEDNSYTALWVPSEEKVACEVLMRPVSAVLMRRRVEHLPYSVRVCIDILQLAFCFQYIYRDTLSPLILID
jgi:hypothetical protein